MLETHVVHTFNVNRELQGTVEKLPDKVARSLIRTGRARAATKEEIESGEAAPVELAEDQVPLGSGAAPAAPSGPATPAEPASEPEPPTPAEPSAGKVTAVPKPSAGKPGPAATAPASPSGDTAGK